MSEETIIVDGNSICHAHHNATKLTVGSMETQAIFGTVKSMQILARSNPNSNILVLWDGNAQWRKDIYPEYKSNRLALNEEQEKRKASYKRQSPFVRKALQLMGIRQMLATSAEADDLGGLMVKKLSPMGKRIKLVTGDQDWLQLVRPGVTWFDPIRDNMVNVSNFFEFTGYRTPEQFLDGKALVGDTSDKISGVGGIGEKGAPEFIAEFGSVERFFQMCDSGVFVPKKKAHKMLNGNSPFTKEEWAEQFEGNKDDLVQLNKHMQKWPGQGRRIFERNIKIMSLLNVPTPPSEDISVIKPTPDREGFRLLCEKLAFHSILRDFDNFLLPLHKESK